MSTRLFASPPIYPTVREPLLVETAYKLDVQCVFLGPLENTQSKLEMLNLLGWFLFPQFRLKDFSTHLQT